MEKFPAHLIRTKNARQRCGFKKRTHAQQILAGERASQGKARNSKCGDEQGWSLEKPELKDANFTGQLTLHGVTKPVTGKVNMSDEKEIEAGFKIKLSEYKIDIPKYLGITVADEVEVTVKIDEIAE